MDVPDVFVFARIVSMSFTRSIGTHQYHVGILFHRFAPYHQRIIYILFEILLLDFLSGQSKLLAISSVIKTYAHRQSTAHEFLWET